MTGTRNSEIKLLFGLLCAALPLGSACADEIRMTGNESLSGNILSISGDGIVELTSPVSPDPIRLKSGAVEKVIFSPPKESVESATAMLELINGDLLPVNLSEMDENSLTVTTGYAGTLTIPRKISKSLQLGIRSSKILYTGPQNLDEWLAGVESGQNWRFENKALVANGQAYVARKFNLPEKFSVSFTVKWQGNPNLQISLADPLGSKGRPSDRYLLQISANGFEIKRESSKGSRFSNVILSNRTPDQFPDQSIDIQLKVDRKASRLHLWVNGEPEASGVDPVPEPPTGGAITLSSQTLNGNELEIKNITVADFDDSKDRHLAEKRGESKTDSLISRDDDRWGGHLLGARKSSEGLVFSFKSDFQQEPLELPESEVSTLFFATEEPQASVSQAHPFVLRLHEKGHLKVSSCSFSETSVLAKHPLLGDMNLSRSGISALECSDLDPQATSEE